MSFRFCVALAAAALLTQAGTAPAQQPIVIKFSHVVAADTPVTEGPVGKQLFQKLESTGITKLACWYNGFKDFSANKALNLPADVKGLKLRK